MVYEAYTAQCLWSIAAGLFSMCGSDFDTPQYVEMVYPEMKKNEPTAEEIKAEVLRLLRE